ncbi:cytochrome d ubiquinol oxidase subunit II [Cellulomonas hominis]|uniref:Cytochrome d ubiquinol oxidase subunit II n=1 Tax=Cellulomonas hominis TaxID=156981 RepID=A0A7Z8JYJ3_9CELL|nr:cytochrome d ubiquinol oxidase subunit II [Cellulomonas hominis]TKR22230.1 cytochrome d ubiquinol oxidase subunit II [Cellulomonas hominis]
MDLPLIWFLLIAVLWTGYLVLEGFDFGVGMLLPFLGRKDKDRRVMINTIGPVWDGNEVWLITAGGATFAAFPEWYATLFSGFYIPLLLILVGLILRIVSFEWRGKINTDTWRAWADRGIMLGSYIPGVLWGVAFANLVRGVELDANHQYVGGFWALLNPFALLGGAVTALLFVTHGAIFLALKTSGEMRDRSGALAARLAPVTLVVAAAWAVWAQLAYSVTWTWAAVALAAVGLLAVVVTTRARREGWAFIWSSVVIVAAVVLIFGSMYPDVMPAFDPANSLTIRNASSTDYTLTIMTWVAVILTPVVLLYQGWTYWVFRKRVSAEHIPEHTGLTFAVVTAKAGASTGHGGTSPDGSTRA